MYAVEEFLRNPSEDLLEACTKDQLSEVAKHFGIELPSQGHKDSLLCVIKESLVQSGVLLTAVKESDTCSVVTPQSSFTEQAMKFERPVAEAGVSLSFEQQKELFMLQHKLTLEHEEKEQAIRAQGQAADIERFKCNVKLCEAELQQERERQQLERYKLELIKEGKALDLTAGKKWELGAGRSPNLDVSGSLRLVPKFSERDPDTFFLLFERLAKNRKWSDSEQTLLLCVDWEGSGNFSALPVLDSENYLKVKMAV